MTLEGKNLERESNNDKCIKLENPDQLGCEIKTENSNTIEELLKNLEGCAESC